MLPWRPWFLKILFRPFSRLGLEMWLSCRASRILGSVCAFCRVIPQCVSVSSVLAPQPAPAAHQRPSPPTPHDRQPDPQIPPTHLACRAKGRLIRHQCTKLRPLDRSDQPERTPSEGSWPLSVTWVLSRCNAFEAGWLAVLQGQSGRQPRLSNRIATRQSWTRHASADAGPGRGSRRGWSIAGQRGSGQRAVIGRAPGVGWMSWQSGLALTTSS